MSEKKVEKTVKQSELPGTADAAGTGRADEKNTERQTVSETWAEETIADLDDFIESQGVYIRQ